MHECSMNKCSFLTMDLLANALPVDTCKIMESSRAGYCIIICYPRIYCLTMCFTQEPLFYQGICSLNLPYSDVSFHEQYMSIIHLAP